MRLFFLIAALSFMTACENPYMERENAVVVYPQAETTPVSTSDDAADDPAIWIHPGNPAGSLILATDKKRGLVVYNLAGTEVQFLARGDLNNVDLRQNVLIDGQRRTLAAATNRTNISIDIFTVSDVGVVEHYAEIPVTLDDPYGICMGLDNQGQAHVFANSSDTEYQHWLLNPQGEFKPELVAGFEVASQPEGCAVDDVTQILYVGEEEYGIWFMPADGRRANEIQLLDAISSGHLVGDVEGMDIYRKSADEVYLIASSQGDNSYAVYDLSSNNAYLGSFRVADNPDNGIDGAQETDGVAVTSVNLGGMYGEGLLVVQDGYNDLPSENQNFKLISWQQIRQSLAL